MGAGWRAWVSVAWRFWFGERAALGPRTGMLRRGHERYGLPRRRIVAGVGTPLGGIRVDPVVGFVTLHRPTAC